MLKKSLKKLKEEAKKESIKHRFSWSRVSKTAKYVRAGAGLISGAALIASKIPLDLSTSNENWLQWVSLAFGFIAGGAWLNKGK